MIDSTIHSNKVVLKILFNGSSFMQMFKDCDLSDQYQINNDVNFSYFYCFVRRKLFYELWRI